MKLKLPPPLVMLIFAGAMYLLNQFLPVGKFEFFGRYLLTYLLIGLGFLVISIALVQFRQAKTTTNPFQPQKAAHLVVNGIFGYTRNPMYLAMLLFLLALALHLGNAFNTLIAAGFVYYMNHFQIIPEEQVLTEKFGKPYRLYLKEVRRWF